MHVVSAALDLMDVDTNRTLAGLYDMIPPVGVRSNGIGEWNRARIVVQGKHVEHWLNGFKTVEYERATQMWRALVNNSKYAVWPAFGERHGVGVGLLGDVAHLQRGLVGVAVVRQIRQHHHGSRARFAALRTLLSDYTQTTPQAMQEMGDKVVRSSTGTRLTFGAT